MAGKIKEFFGKKIVRLVCILLVALALIGGLVTAAVIMSRPHDLSNVKDEKQKNTVISETALPDGSTETVYSDGSIVVTNPDGSTVITNPDGSVSNVTNPGGSGGNSGGGSSGGNSGGSSGGGSGGSSGGSNVTKPPVVNLSGDSVVALMQASQTNAGMISQEEIDRIVAEAVTRAGGFKELVTGKKTIVLKPNLVTANDYCYSKNPTTPQVNGNTTDYRVTRAVAKLIRSYNPTCKISVMEGSASDTEAIMQKLCYTKQDIPEVDEFVALETASGSWQQLNSDKLVAITPKSPYMNQKYYLNKQIYTADVLISLPALKDHWDAAITGGVKNIAIGTTPASVYGNTATDSWRSKIDHETQNYYNFIADFYMCRPADYTIMDGLQGLEYGPTPDSSRYPSITSYTQCQKNMRLILAGRDAVAVDSVEANLMNWDHTTVMYLSLLADKGAGKNDIKNITVLGNVSIDDVRKTFAGNEPRKTIDGNVKTVGKHLTDLLPPSLSNVSAALSSGKIKVTYQAGSDCSKIEILLNDVLVYKTISITGSAEFAASVGANDLYTVKVVAYDSHWNAKAVAVTTAYMAKFAQAAPVIDGNIDAVWDSVQWAPIDQWWGGAVMPSAADFSGSYKMLWTADRLYLLAEITDDQLVDLYPNPTDKYWQDDTLEFFIDENNGKENHQTNYNAFAYHISTKLDAIDIDTSGGPVNLKDNIRAALKPMGNNKYIWEVEFKIYGHNFVYGGNNTPLTLTEGKRMGYAVAYCDADGSGDRDSFMGSIFIPGKVSTDERNVAWQTSAVFGETLLVK